MANRNVVIEKDSVDQSVDVFIQKASDGTAYTGLVYNTASLACHFRRGNGAVTQLALATQTATGAHADGGFVELDATNMPGWYRLDLSDAIVATGVDRASVVLAGASDMHPSGVKVELVDAPADIVVGANVEQWAGNAVATSVNGVPRVDVTHVAGAAEDLPTATDLATALSDLVVLDTKADTIISDVALIDLAPVTSGLTIARSDLVVVEGKIDTALSDLVVLDTKADTTISDIALIDLAPVTSSLAIVKSDLVVLDTKADTTISDIALLDPDSINSNLTIVRSDLVVVEGKIDTALSDLVVLDTKADTTISDIALLNPDSINSNLTIVRSDLVVVEGKLDTALSDLVVLDTKADTTISDIALLGPDSINSNLTIVRSDLVVIEGKVDTALSDLVVLDGKADTALSDLVVATSDLIVLDGKADSTISDLAVVDAAIGTLDGKADAILADTGTDIPATLATIAAYIDTEIAAIKAVTDLLPDGGALTAVTASLSTLDTLSTAIKAKTDSLTFTQAGMVDANLQMINDHTLAGDGVATKFTVA